MACPQALEGYLWRPAGTTSRICAPVTPIPTYPIHESKTTLASRSMVLATPEGRQGRVARIALPTDHQSSIAQVPCRTYFDEKRQSLHVRSGVLLLTRDPELTSPY